MPAQLLPEATEHERTPVLTLLLALIAAGLAVTAINPAILAGDPLVYYERVSDIITTGLPYLQVPFEHFPGALVPMFAAWGLGGWLNPVAYTWVFGALMVLCLVGIGIVMTHLQHDYDSDGAALRWVLLTAPLLPFVLFRTEPWVVLLVALAIFGLQTDRKTLAAWTGGAAILSKGWPASLVVIAWQSKYRRVAVGLIALALGTVGWLSTNPLFFSSREFSGLHTESLVGAFVGLLRVINGEPLGRVDAAGATYLSTGVELQLLQVTAGIVLAVFALVRLNKLTKHTALSLTGALVGAFLVGSPLLSPQFLMWLTPFVSLARRRVVSVLGFATMLLTMIYMTGLVPGFESRIWTLPILNIRNLLLVALVSYICWSVGEEDRSLDFGEPVGQGSMASEKALAVLGLSSIVAWLILALAHRTDLFHVDHASRVRIALAHSSEAGNLYPALFDGVHYAGTRFMPLPTWLHGQLASLIEDYVLSGKLIVYFAFIAAGILFVFVLRTRNVSWSLAGGLLALVLVTQAGLFTTLGIRFDALSLAFQLGALVLVERASRSSVRSGPAIVAAAALCAGALLTKSTALWAPIAIVVWLFWRDRRTAWLFVGATGFFTATAFVMVQSATDGAFWVNLKSVSAAGLEGGFSGGRAVERFVVYNYRKSAVALPIMVLALSAIYQTTRGQKVLFGKGGLSALSLYQLSFLLSIAGTIVLMSDVGLAENHFLDFLMLGALVIGLQTGETSPKATRPSQATFSFATKCSILLILSASVLPLLGDEIGSAVGGQSSALEARLSIESISSLPENEANFLSEDPLIPILKDRQPLILDSWVLSRLVSDGLVDERPLIERIERQEFPVIILWNWPLEALDQYLTPSIRTSISAHYKACRESFDHIIFRPSDRQDHC